MKMNSNLQSRKLKPLPNEIRSVVRSGITINTVAQCVEELVYNSIDAGAKNIHVGVNLEMFNVRVEDDGSGLNEVDLEAVGVRYTTSKCNSLADLNNLQSYGFRGEALASIIEVSNTVDIISRPKETVGIELKKKFENGIRIGFIEKYNTTVKKSGATVIVGKLLSKLPVRQQRIDKSIQLEEVKSSIETIVLINPDLNIEIRNERNGTMLFSFKPASCYADALNQLYMSRIGFEVKFVQEHFLHKKFFFSLSASNDLFKKKHYQFVFINNRFIRRCKIHKWIGNFILDKSREPNSPKSDKYPIFILNITCPFDEYDITLEPKKQVVEFKDWDAIYSGIDGLILKLKHKNSLAQVINKAESVNKNASLISSYDVKGALHSRFVAREADESSVRSSCTGSDAGSFGRSSLPKSDTKVTNRNIIRSSHNTHVVNVRELRKKRRLENIVATKTVPFKPKLSPSASKPRLTLGTFKRFPEWQGEFDKTDPGPSKRFKESHNQENYKYYLPDVHSSERSNHAEVDKEQLYDTSNYKWKINHFLQKLQPEASITSERPLSETGDGNLQDQDISSPPNFNPVDPDYSNGIPSANPVTSYVDVEKYILDGSEKVIKNHMKDKWTLRNVKEDIMHRLIKYYKETNKVVYKKRKATTTASGHNHQTDGVAAAVSNAAHKKESVIPGHAFTTTSGNSNHGCVASSSNPAISQIAKSYEPEVQILNISNKNNTRSSFVTPNHNNVVHQDGQEHQETKNAPLDTSSGITTGVGVLQMFNNFVTTDSTETNARQSIAQPDPTSATTVMPKTGMFVSSSKQEPIFFTGNSGVHSLVKPPNLEFMKFGQGMEVAEAKSCAPPLLNLFPVQKSFTTDWNDKMMTDDYTETNDNLFPSDWAAEIVMDQQGQEWLQTLDSNGKNVYINLSSGVSSYDIVHLHGSLRKVTAGELKKSNPVRFNWLRRHFPRGFKRFWDGDTREVVKEGDWTRLNSSTIGNSLLKCINQQKSNDQQLSKWNSDELKNVSKYFSNQKDSSIKTVNNVSATGIQCWKNLGGTTTSYRFSREDFEMIRVIGQYDRKFILAGIRKSLAENETLVIFDQHAVHERIRLEQLTMDSFKSTKAALKYLKSSEVIPPYQLPLSETEVRIMSSYAECFHQAALKFDPVSSTSVKIKSVPKCFIEKCSNEPSANREEVFRNLVHGLIQELIHTIMETKVASLTGLPKIVHSTLCSQACHGAIKFGDVLDLDACKQLILNLRNCKNLFQCAHGRPSVVPLIKGQDMLKVSAAGLKCLLDRQPQPYPEGESSSCIQPHEECSNYFCNTKEENTSNYFSLLDASTTSKRDEVKDNQSHLLPTGVSESNKNITSTSDFFSFVSGDKLLNEEYLERSPYF